MPWAFGLEIYLETLKRNVIKYYKKIRVELNPIITTKVSMSSVLLSFAFINTYRFILYNKRQFIYIYILFLLFIYYLAKFLDWFLNKVRSSIRRVGKARAITCIVYFRCNIHWSNIGSSSWIEYVCEWRWPPFIKILCFYHRV